MISREHCQNWLLGLSVLSWAVLGLIEAGAEARFTPVRLAIATLNLTVGLLFMVRQPLRASAPLSAFLYSIPSLVIAGWAINAAPPPQQWPAAASALFVAAVTFAIFAFLCLGRSFAIFPGLRRVMTGGPYRLVRHPAYLSEWVLVVACFLARPHWLSFLPVVLAIPLLMTRIQVEEDVLRNDPLYLEYARQVRWRLFPGIW